MAKFFLVTVTYSQGIVKRWLVPSETLAIRFAAVAGHHGKIRGMTFGREIDAGAAQVLTETEGAAFFFERPEQEVIRG